MDLYPSTMCSKCREIYAGIPVEPHPVVMCPVMKSYYCSYCQSYGHLTRDCADWETRVHREPIFVEQLLSPHLVKKHNITTLTLLPSVQNRLIGDSYWEVEDTDRMIRQLLMNHSKPISGKSKENRKRLEGLATELGKKLVFLSVK